MKTVTSPGNVHESFGYDALGRLSAIQGNGSAESLTLSYPAAGQVTLTAADAAATNCYFDDRGLLVKMRDPLNRSLQLTYNSDYELTQVTDAAGESYSAQYDDSGNLLGYADPLGNHVQFAYQTLTTGSGNFYRLASFSDPDGNAVQYAYNTQGDLTATTYADGSQETLGYQGDGDPTSSTNRRGQQIVYTYDSAGRITSKTYPDKSQVIYKYDSRGNLVQTTDSTGVTTFKYDGNDYLKEIDYPGGRVLKFTYDAAGRRASMTDQAGHVTCYSYDAAGRLKQLTDGAKNNIILYEYDADGRVSKETKGNVNSKTCTVYAYYADGQVKSVVNSSGGKTVSSFTYTYDDATGLCSSMTTLDGAWTYRYDADGQLVYAKFASKNPAALPNQELSYQYDAAGNRISVTQNGVTIRYTTNDLDQYSSVGNTSYWYDRDGNLVCQQDGSGGATYKYDAENRLIHAEDSQGTWDYQYDAFGQLVGVTHNGQKTSYVIDPTTALGDVVGQYGANGAIVAQYVQGLGLVSRVDASGNAAYYDFDALGSTADMTGGSGAVCNSYSYDPFGNVMRKRNALLIRSPSSVNWESRSWPVDCCRWGQDPTTPLQADLHHLIQPDCSAETPTSIVT